MTEPRTFTERCAAIGRRIFHRRMHVGLAAVALGALLFHPRPIFGAHQREGAVASIMLVLLGLAGRAWAGGSAGRHTREASIEAPRLATGGPFAYVRNPIYLSSIVLGLGMVLLLGDPWMAALYVGVFIFLYTSIVPAEEQFLRQQFPEEYARYCAHVPRIVPRLRPWPGARSQPFDWTTLLHEARLGLILIAIYAGLHAAAWLRGVGKS